MNSFGSLDKDFLQSFEKSFQNNCLTLIGEAYRELKTRRVISIEWDEENITANIQNCIKTNPKSSKWNILTIAEYPHYTSSILNNEVKAKAAPRFDLCFIKNWELAQTQVSFSVETKKLVEHNCTRNSRKTKINALRLQSEYILNGMDRFISGKYPSNGCMMGYVLEGKSNNIIEGINMLLKQQGRSEECLKKKEINIPNLEDLFLSLHDNNLTLRHLFLNFA